MPSNWNELVGEVKNLVSFFSGGDIKVPYPFNKDDKNKLLNDYKEKNNWNKSLSYSFRVVDKTKGKTADIKPTPNTKGFEEFKLTINPLELTQDENFAINITPTQNGVISEHNGIVFRDLIISGTTGIHPGRGTGGSDSKGRVIGGDPNSSKNRTGYEEFNQLRNYFRAYSKHKKSVRTGTIPRNSVLIFINRKDNETLIIEPLKFQMKRTSQRGPLYDYVITCKVIGNFDLNEGKEDVPFLKELDDAIDSINDTLNTGRGILLRSEALIRQFEREISNTFYEPLRNFDLFVKQAGGFDNSMANMGKNIISRFNASLTGQFIFQAKEQKETATEEGNTDNTLPQTKLPDNVEKASRKGGEALLDLGDSALFSFDLDEGILPEDIANDFNSEKDAAASLPKSFFSDLLITSNRIKDNLAEAFGLGDTTFNAWANRDVTFVPSPTKQTTAEEVEILFGFSQIIQALNLVLAYGGDVFEKNLEETFEEKEQNFNNLINLPVPSSVDEIVIPPDQSLEDIAFINLGDISRWIEIACLNGLIPPYVTDDSSNTNPRIKNVGDRLLLPSEGIQIDTDVVLTGENKFNRDLNETEKRLGIDFQLTKGFDFSFNNRDDINIIRGGRNAGQAITIKMNLEKGDLRYHPNIGLGLIVGEKNTGADELFDDITEAILRDPRFQNINNFDLKVEGNTIVIDLNLFVTESSTPVPLSLNL